MEVYLPLEDLKSFPFSLYIKQYISFLITVDRK